MKALRIILAVFGGLLAVLVIAAIILVKTFDPNDYKDEITAYVQERTGRTLAINEEIQLSLFPWFAVETGGVTLSDDPNFGERSFATIDELSARVRVWPLLKRRVEIGKVVFDGITLNLGVDTEGRGNWASLVQTATPEAPAAPQTNAARPRFEQLAVEGIDLRNTRILWHDPNGEVRYLVRELRLVTGAIADNAPIEFSLVMSLLDVASQASVDFDLESLASFAPNLALSGTEGTIRMRDAREQERVSASINLDSVVLDDRLVRSGPATVVARLVQPPVGAERLELTNSLTALEFNTETGQLVVTGLSTRSGGLAANWNLRGDGLLSEPTLAGSVNLQGATIVELLATLGLATPEALSATEAGGFTGTATFDLGLTPLTLTVERFALTALGLEATGDARLAADRTVTARIDVPAFRPGAPLLGVFGPMMPAEMDLGAIRSASLNATLTLPANGDRLDVGQFALALDAARLGGRIAITGLQSPSRIAGSLTASGLDNHLLTALFNSWLPQDMLDATLGDFRLVTNFDYATESKVAVFNPLELDAYGLSGNGQLTLVAGGNTLALSGQASLDTFSPRALLARFDLPVPQSADPTTLTSAELAASFETTGDSGSFRDIVIELDDSRITGEFSVENFSDPSYRFVLRADRIDADRYLPPRAAPTANEAVAASGAGSAERKLGDIRLATESLTATVVNGSASVGQLDIGGMRFEQLATDLAVGNGRAELSSVRTRLYDGEFAGGVTIDATTETPTVHLAGNASNLSMRPLLQAMLGGAYMSGTGNFGLDLTGRGATIGDAMQSSAGTMNVAFSNGQIDGVNVGRKLCAAVNAARQLPAPSAAADTTSFTEIRASARVSEGVATTSDLFAATSFVNLTGQGNMRLIDQRLDTSFVARLTGPINLAGCESLNARVDGSIPIGFTLKGQFPEVEVGFDIRQLIEDWISREIRNQAQDAVRDRLQDVIRGLSN